jgi:hypothetical protein
MIITIANIIGVSEADVQQIRAPKQNIPPEKLAAAPKN